MDFKTQAPQSIHRFNYATRHFFLSIKAMELLNIVHSKIPSKKFTAHFRTRTGKTHTIHFGAAGMDDYTKTHDKEQRERYRIRHAHDLETPASRTGVSAGALSYYVLWGDSTSLRKNIEAYVKRFDL